MHTHTWQSFKFASVCLLSYSLHLPLKASKDLLDFFDNLFLCNNILHTHCEAVIEQPVVDDVLGVGHPVFSCFWPQVLPNDVYKTSWRSSNLTLFEVSADELSVLHIDVCVLGASPCILVSNFYVVDLWQN